jgi:SH3-like domain-containing protein
MMPAEGSAGEIGRTTGLAVPRFVSIKARPANVRVGPSTDYPIKWTFVRRELPVEVTAEFERWRRIRDWEGKEGWMLGALLSGRRMALVSPWPEAAMVPLRSDESSHARIVALVQPKVLVRIEKCDGQWCAVRAKSRHGYIRQTKLWGVYPGEAI